MSWSKDGNRKLSPDSCGLGQLCVWFWPQEALFAGCWGSWREGPWGCLVKAVGLILHRASKAPGDFFPPKTDMLAFPPLTPWALPCTSLPGLCLWIRTPDDPVPDLLGSALAQGRLVLEMERQEGKEVRWFFPTSSCLCALSPPGWVWVTTAPAASPPGPQLSLAPLILLTLFPSVQRR